MACSQNSEYESSVQAAILCGIYDVGFLLCFPEELLFIQCVTRLIVKISSFAGIRSVVSLQMTLLPIVELILPTHYTLCLYLFVVQAGVAA